jgi:hypothetical protein
MRQDDGVVLLAQEGGGKGNYEMEVASRTQIALNRVENLGCLIRSDRVELNYLRIMFQLRRITVCPN